MYSQISLGDDASNAGLYIGTFFFGYVVAAQWGGSILDKQGAKAAVVPGCAIAAVGFYLWGNQMPDLDYSSGWWRIVVAGVGTGLILGPISTDALNRSPGTSYGEVTGITQTARNLGASFGLAVLGTLLISQNRTHVEDAVAGVPGIGKEGADKIAESLTQAGGGSGSGDFASHAGEKAQEIFKDVQLAFAQSTETVFYVMAGAMAAALLVAIVFLPAGKAPEAEIVE
jgi:fucose permease